MPAIEFGKRKQKNKKRRPDETFEAGPIALARFGRLIVARNIASSKSNEEFQEKIPDVYRDLEGKIASEISALRVLLAPLDPLHFLHQAFSEFFVAHLGVEDEPSVTFEDHGVPARLVDYCQSLFAALPPVESPRQHTEDEFEIAKEHIRELFRATQHYIGIRTHPRLSGTNNQALSQLVSKLTYSWVFVRSDRHAYFELPHHTDLLRPLDPILKRVLHVSADDLIAGFARILDNAQSGFGTAGIELMELHETLTDHPSFETLVQPESSPTPVTLAEMSGRSVEQIEDALQSFFGVQLFDIKRATGWPDHIIAHLSYSPGEAAAFLEPASKACWPTRVWPIFQKPFIKLDGVSYCFDYIAFCDRFYRQITKLLRNLDPTSAEELGKVQAATVESIAEIHIRKLLPGAAVYRNAFYRVDGEFCEVDLVAVYKDVIVVGEVRSGSITPESPTDDLKSYFESIQGLLLKPLSQAWRLLKLLEKHDVELFDTNKPDRKAIGRLHRSNFAFKIPMSITLDGLQMMGAHLANTLAALEKQALPVWAVTIDDLRCMAELFDSPSIFLHYATIRMQAASRMNVEVMDELDHVGLYHRENNYVMQTDDFDAPLRRHGYTTDIDRYFFGLGSGEERVRPAQTLALNITSIVSACDLSSLELSRRFSAAVLDADEETRSRIASWLEDQRRDPPATGRFRMFTLTFGTENLAIFYSNAWGLSPIQQANVEAKARLVGMPNVENALVALLYYDRGTLKLVSCSRIDKSAISSAELSSLMPVRKAQEQRDFAGLQRKIGRNETCPCGSGLRYKRCHGR